jgi:hypothetical protein
VASPPARSTTSCAYASGLTSGSCGLTFVQCASPATPVGRRLNKASLGLGDCERDAQGVEQTRSPHQRNACGLPIAHLRSCASAKRAGGSRTSPTGARHTRRGASASGREKTTRPLNSIRALFRRCWRRVRTSGEVGPCAQPPPIRAPCGGKNPARAAPLVSRSPQGRRKCKIKQYLRAFSTLWVTFWVSIDPFRSSQTIGPRSARFSRKCNLHTLSQMLLIHPVTRRGKRT